MNEYRKLCNNVCTAARSDKENWFKKKCQEIERSNLGNNSHKMYKVIKELNRNWQPKQKVIKAKDRRLLTTPVSHRQATSLVTDCYSVKLMKHLGK